MFTKITEAQSRQKSKEYKKKGLFVPNNDKTKVKHETHLLDKHHKRTLLKMYTRERT